MGVARPGSFECGLGGGTSVMGAGQEKLITSTHWSTRTMVAVTGLSEKGIRRIWHRHCLKPHLSRTFKVSNDPQFSEKLEAIMGLYISPPEHAIVLCVDEKLRQDWA